MFLYAKVVLSNLLSQPTRGHFKMELQEENFPKGMDQAYVFPETAIATKSRRTNQ
jgi:hypothetical protein